MAFRERGGCFKSLLEAHCAPGPECEDSECVSENQKAFRDYLRLGLFWPEPPFILYIRKSKHRKVGM